MRKIELKANDDMFDVEMNPTDFEFFVKHLGTFKRMWEEQTKDFWIRYIIAFRVFQVKYGCIKGQVGEDYTFIIDQGFIYIHEEFLEGKYSHAKNFMMDIAQVAQKRNMLACLDPGNYAKNPFYRRETRDVFRRLFGHPDHNDSYMKVCLLFPLYCKFGGSVCMCLRRWLEAKDMDPSDDSYWTPPQEEKPTPKKDKSIPKQKTAPKPEPEKPVGGTKLIIEGAKKETPPFQIFWNERSCGSPNSPQFVKGWPNNKNPCFFDNKNPLYNLEAKRGGDWREGVNYVTFVEFIEYCRENYLKLPKRDLKIEIPDDPEFEKCRQMLLKDKVNDSSFPTQREFWQSAMPTLKKIKAFEESHNKKATSPGDDNTADEDKEKVRVEENIGQDSETAAKKKRKRKKKGKGKKAEGDNTSNPTRMEMQNPVTAHPQCVNCKADLPPVTIYPTRITDKPEGSRMNVQQIIQALSDPNHPILRESSESCPCCGGEAAKSRETRGMKVVIEKKKGDNTIVKTTIENNQSSSDDDSLAGATGSRKPEDSSSDDDDALPLFNEEVQRQLLEHLIQKKLEIPEVKGHSAVIHGRGRPADDGKPTYNMSFKFEDLPSGSTEEDIVRSKQSFVEHINKMMKASEEPDYSNAIRRISEENVQPRTREERQREKLRKKLAEKQSSATPSLSKVEKATLETIATSAPKRPSAAKTEPAPKEHPISRKVKHVVKPAPPGIYTDDEDEEEEDKGKDEEVEETFAERERESREREPRVTRLLRKEDITADFLKQVQETLTTVAEGGSSIATEELMLQKLLMAQPTPTGRLINLPSSDEEEKVASILRPVFSAEKFGTEKKPRKLRKCSHCLREEPKPKAYRKCLKCKELGVKSARYYCGRDCQVEDWNNRHKQEHKDNTLE